MTHIGNILKELQRDYLHVIDKVEDCMPQLESAVCAIGEHLSAGGRIALLEEKGYADKSMGKEEISCPGVGDIMFAVTPSGMDNNIITTLRAAKRRGVATVCLTFNPASPVIDIAQYPVVLLLGEEKTGETEKIALELILGMIKRCICREPDVDEEKKVVTEDDLVEKGVDDIMRESGMNDYERAKDFLFKYGSVHKAVEKLKENVQ